MAWVSVSGLYNARNELFDDMVLPSGMDKDILINYILLECNELEVLYPNPDFMIQAIKSWSTAQLEVWNKLYSLFNESYNPIWNVDGTETITETRDLVNGGTSANSVTGFNSSEYQPSNKRDDSFTDKGTITTERTRGGNIGVTMTQQMIKAEMDVRPQMNIYKYIADDFKNRFCLLIY